MDKHYLIYKTTNKLNKTIYIGQHQTYNIDDGYMGSGKLIIRAMNKHRLENFTTEILFDFDNYEDMNNKEKELVNEEFVKRNDTYNIILGGCIDMTGLVSVKDINGQTFQTSKDDPRYLSGELTSLIKGRKWIYNTKLNKRMMVEKHKISEYLVNDWKLGKIIK